MGFGNDVIQLQKITQANLRDTCAQMSGNGLKRAEIRAVYTPVSVNLPSFSMF
jgi:hypothetical protein